MARNVARSQYHCKAENISFIRRFLKAATATVGDRCERKRTAARYADGDELDSLAFANTTRRTRSMCSRSVYASLANLAGVRMRPAASSMRSTSSTRSLPVSAPWISRTPSADFSLSTELRASYRRRRSEVNSDAALSDAVNCPATRIWRNFVRANSAPVRKKQLRFAASSIYQEHSMRELQLALLAAAVIVGSASAQTPAAAPAAMAPVIRR